MIKETIEFVPKCGFHRTSLCGFTPHIIDTSKAEEVGLPIIYDDKRFVLSDNAVPYTSITFPYSRDYNLLKMNIRPTVMGDYLPNCKLDFAPDKLLGLLTLDEYKKKLADLTASINDKYGVMIDTSNARLQSCELACEFILPHPLTDYWRAFRILSYMKSNYSAEASDFWTNKIDSSNDWKYTLLKFKNYEFYIYNKTQQLKEARNVQLSHEVCKMELRFSDLIHMNNKLCYEINEMESDTITKSFQRYFKKSIRKPYELWIKDYDNNLEKLIKEYYKKSHWITDILAKCSDSEHYKKPLLLDIEDILNCKVLDSDTNPARTKRTFVRACQEHTIFTLNTRQRIQEIFDAIDSCFITAVPTTITAIKH